MEVKIRHLQKAKFQVQSRQHTILSDQPTENGGDDSAMTPPELFLASLGSCAAFYAAQYLRIHRLAESGTEVSVTSEKLRQPPRLGNITVQVTVPVVLTDEQRLGVERSVHQCLIHNTLLTPPNIKFTLNLAGPESSGHAG